MHTRMVLVLMMAAAALSGCSATGPKYKPMANASSDESVLYVFRPKTVYMSALSAIIFVDGQRVAKLRNNGYVALPVKAGRHVIRHEWDSGLLGDSRSENRPIELGVMMLPEGQHFVRIGAVANLGYFETEYLWELRELSPEQAQAELNQCKLEPMTQNLQPSTVAR